MNFFPMKFLPVFFFLTFGIFSCSFKAQSSQNNVVCPSKNFTPKSEVLIAAMTPRQLVEELVTYRPSGFDKYKESVEYRRSLENRIRKAGGNVLPILTEYFDSSFRKRNSFDCDKSRFSTADTIAWDLDRFEFRLRGETRGRQTIDAFERAIKRAEKTTITEKAIGYFKEHLSDLRGTNFYDNYVQNTFLIRKSIKLSDEEMLKFSNYLVKLDPTYPSWSDTENFKDYSRINEAGNPLQRFILKKPMRFYKAYEDFRRNYKMN